MTDDSQIRPSSSIAIAFGASLVGLGIILTLIAQLLDGFPQGLFLGAGLALTLIGVFTLSGTLRRQFRGDAEPAGEDDTWLPSRDGER